MTVFFDPKKHKRRSLPLMTNSFGQSVGPRAQFRLNLLALLDGGLCRGEAGVIISHLQIGCKHTVNNLPKTMFQ